MLLLVDNKSNIICLSISIFKKPNVNGTLERTKSAPGEGKSAQNKIEEKKTEENKLSYTACIKHAGRGGLLKKWVK